MSNADTLADMIDHVDDGKEQLFADMISRGLTKVQGATKTFLVEQVKPRVSISKKNLLLHYSNYPDELRNESPFDMLAFIVSIETQHKENSRIQEPKQKLKIRNR